MCIHTILGILILLSTIALSLIGINICYMKLTMSAHNILGLAIFFVSPAVALFGMFTQYKLNKLKWRTFRLQGYKLAHKAAGYIMIFVSQIAILTGSLRYNNIYHSSSPLGIISTIAFFVGLLITEIAFRLYRRRQPLYKGSENKMTIEEFSRRVESGQ